MATRADVARLAGVSESTVSYALNGSRAVSRATRERIEAAMDELGYTPHPLARGLAHGRTGLVALQIPVTERGLQLTEVDYLEGASRAARAAGYHLLVWATPGDGEDFRRVLGQRIAEGVLLMEVRIGDDRIAPLRAAGVPFALIGRTGQDEGIDFVDADFDAMGASAIGHLADLGHRRVLFLTRSEEFVRGGHGPSIRAERAVLMAASLRGVHVVVRRLPSLLREGWAALADALDADPGVTAIVSINEQATVGAMSLARQRGLGIPEDLSVVALGLGEASAEMTVPALTNVAPPAAEISLRGMAALLRRISSPDATAVQELVSTPLVPRGSSGPAPHPERS